MIPSGSVHLSYVSTLVATALLMLRHPLRLRILRNHGPSDGIGTTTEVVVLQRIAVIL